jgi:putative ABC transport system permease protein
LLDVRPSENLSWQELIQHPWRNAAAGWGALAFSVHVINASALDEFSQAVRSVNGQPDLELRSVQGSFDETLFARVSRHPQVQLASPVLELGSYALASDGRRASVRVVGIDALVVPFVAPDLMPLPSKAADRLALFAPDTVFLNAAAQKNVQGDTLRLRPQMHTVTVAGKVRGRCAGVMDMAQRRVVWQAGAATRVDLRLQVGVDALPLRARNRPDCGTELEPARRRKQAQDPSRAYRVNLLCWL